MMSEVKERLLQMVGPDIGTGVARVTDSNDLKTAEMTAIASAIPKRRAEFAAGRRAARLALAEIGKPDATVPAGADRAPQWPEGTLGSITHDDGLALSIVAARRKAGALGIDLTEAAPLPGGTREQILRHRFEAGLTDIEARAAFSAKESLFKALAPHVGFVFGFAAAVIETDLDGGSFRASLVQPLGPFPKGQSWNGRLAIVGQRLVTVLVVNQGELHSGA